MDRRVGADNTVRRHTRKQNYQINWHFYELF